MHLTVHHPLGFEKNGANVPLISVCLVSVGSIGLHFAKVGFSVTSNSMCLTKSKFILRWITTRFKN